MKKWNIHNHENVHGVMNLNSISIKTWYAMGGKYQMGLSANGGWKRIQYHIKDFWRNFQHLISEVEHLCGIKTPWLKEGKGWYSGAGSQLGGCLGPAGFSTGSYTPFILYLNDLPELVKSSTKMSTENIKPHCRISTRTCHLSTFFYWKLLGLYFGAFGHQ